MITDTLVTWQLCNTNELLTVKWTSLMIYILLIHPVVAVLRVIKVLRFFALLRQRQRSVDI